MHEEVSGAPRHGGATSDPSGRFNSAPADRARRWLLSTTAIGLLLAGAFVPLASSWARSGPDPFATTGKPAAEASVALPDFVPIVKAVKPAVVAIRVKSKASGVVQVNPFEGTPFEQFFRQFGGPNANSGNGPAPRFQQALGSGFIISPDGYVVTNNHVVDGAVNVEVTMDDGSQLNAKVVGTDKRTDLALLKVSGRNDLPFVRLADATPAIGSWVVAMGNPFGLGGTVTSGIVSAEGRDIGSGPYDDYIQIDAPVNRGNSGGPTFDMRGQVIGVNTAIYSPSGGSVGIAFDIPAPVVRTVVTQLAKSGRVERGWIGVEVQPVTRAIADSLGLAKASGALISEPQPGSPASKAGLKSGDIITAVDGKDIPDARHLARTVAGFPPGTEVTLSVQRDGKQQQVKIALGEFRDKTAINEPSGRAEPDAGVGKLGLTVAPASSVEGAGEQGLAVLSVDPNGGAAETGLQAGDVILKAGGAEISSVRDLRGAMAKAKGAGKKHALALVRHDKSEHYVALPVG